MNIKLQTRPTTILLLLITLSLSTASSSAQNQAHILAGTTERVSVASDGTQGNSGSYRPFISTDGRYVAFSSSASNLVNMDTNYENDIFVHDRQTGVTSRVSIASDGTQGNNWSGSASISADGRYMAFDSLATNLVRSDTNSEPDIFLHDRMSGDTIWISVASDGTQGNGHSYDPTISADGRFVTFSSNAYNLVSNDTNNYCDPALYGSRNCYDIFVYNQTSGINTRDSVSSDGSQGNGASFDPTISFDGRYVAFQSDASNLVDMDTNNRTDIFVHDRVTGETTRVSVASDGMQGIGYSSEPSISGDGRYVAFRSWASNLVVGDTNNTYDVFVHDRQTGETTRVSISSEGLQGNNSSGYPFISGNGRYVAFCSSATNLADGVTSLTGDVYIHNRESGETKRISLTNDGTQGNDISWYPSISTDGRFVAFESDASNIVDEDTNEVPDVFVHDQGIVGESYSISGQITNLFGSPLDGVTVSAGAGYSAISDSEGNYTITNLPAGTYTITPSLAGYNFSPPSRTVIVASDVGGQDFKGTAFFITRFEVNQGLGQQQNGEQNYVAGKATAIRVFLNLSITTNSSTQQIIVRRNGILTTWLYPKLQGETTDVLEFLCPTMNNCGSWPAGSYTFEVSVDGVLYQSESYEFVEGKDLQILAVPIRIKFNGQVLEPPDESWKTAQIFVNNVYPLAFNSVNWVEGPTFIAEDLDLKSEMDKSFLIARLSAYRIFLCHLSSGQYCYDHIVGFIPNICQPGKGCQVGWSKPYPLNTASVVMTMRDVNAIVAHEIGHNYGLGDEYQGGDFYCDINPPPKEYYGRECSLWDCELNIHCEESDAISWSIPGAGSKVVGVGEDQDYPYDNTGEGDLDDMLSFMGLSGFDMSIYWVTPDIYHHLFAELTSTEQALSSTPEAEMMIQANGWIGLDGSVQLEPWYAFSTLAQVQITGTYTIEALDALDQVLVSQGFEISFLMLSDPPTDLDTAPFQVSLPFPAGTSAFQIRKGGEVLSRMDVSDNSPVVNVTSPNGGETWEASGEGTITWTGSDADGDTLYYTVLYAPDGADWVTVNTNITATQTTVALDEIPGGVGARIQVVATDGINTSLDESDGVFTVGGKEPRAYILNPSTNAVIPNGTSFYLHGYAYDPEDGSLGESALGWSSNVDGYLGTGALLLVNLSPGYHTITMTATDSTGATATDTISVYIGSLMYLPVARLNR